MTRLSAWRALWLALGDPFRMGLWAALSAVLLFWIDTARLFVTSSGGVDWLNVVPGGLEFAVFLQKFGWSDVMGIGVAVAFFVLAAPRALRRAGVTLAPAKPSERMMFVAISVVVMYLLLKALAFLVEQNSDVGWHTFPTLTNDRVFFTLWAHVIIEAALIWCISIAILRCLTHMEIASPLFGLRRGMTRPLSLLVTATLFGTLTGLWIIGWREILQASNPFNTGEALTTLAILLVACVITSYAILVKLAFITRLYFDRDALPETAKVFD